MKYNEHLEDIYIEWVIEDWNKFNDQYNDYNTWYNICILNIYIY